MKRLAAFIVVAMLATPSYAQLASPKINGYVVLPSISLQSPKANSYVVLKSCLGMPKINGYVILKSVMLRLLNEFTITSAAAQWWPKWGPQAGGVATPTCQASG